MDLLLLISIAITIVAQIFVSTSYSKYKKIESNCNITGAEIARTILEKNGLKNVYVTEVKGTLTDHYDPTRKVVRLSHDIYNGTSIAAVSVAAHECGHALQDKDGYVFMRIRGNIIPFVNLSSKLGYFAILIGIIFSLVDLIWLGIAFEVIILLFQLITLPVEFDASRRAEIQIQNNDFLNKEEQQGSKKMLLAAAFTYVASVITVLLEILRLVMMASRRRD